MSSIKNILKRYLKSINATFWIIYYKYARKKNLEDLFSKEFKNIHVFCPGPSAQNFFINEHVANEQDAVILVNHALNLCPKLFKYTNNIFFFSSDGTRVKESITLNNNLLENIFSVVSSTHLFHLDKSIIKKIDVVTLPKLSFSKYFGIIGVNKGPENFDALKVRSKASGFGSLIYSLQLAVKFNPENIYLWGCDFGDSKGKRYFAEGIPVRKTQAFKKTKEHFEIVERIIQKKGINLIR